MSALDWAASTAGRLRSEPPRKAVAGSLSELRRGAGARLTRAAVALPPRPGTMGCEVAGMRGRFHVESSTDVKRAADLNGEAEVAAFLSPGLGPGEVFWDVGAYHGHYSILAEDAGADVLAFEPNPDNRRRLRKNIGLNGAEVRVKALALSDASGTARLDPSMGPESELDRGAEMVRMRRGDRVSPRPDAVKIDVEGHELNVLRGMGRALSGVGRVAVEVHDGAEAPEIKSLLSDDGFEVCELGTGRTQPHIGGTRP